VSRPYVVLDLDGTLTIDDKRRPYPEREPNPAIRAAADAAREAGWGVMVMTARGMRTHHHDRDAVEKHVRPGVETWLRGQGFEADEVHVAKPWCRTGGFYVDDRNLHLEEMGFRFTGPLSDLTVAVEAHGVPTTELRAIHFNVGRLERWLDLCAFSYPDTDPGVLGHKLPADDDTRAADRVLLTRLDRGRPDVAGWFAAHHPLLSEQARTGFMVPDSATRAGFAFGPPSVLATAAGDPMALRDVLPMRGWDGEPIR